MSNFTPDPGTLFTFEPTWNLNNSPLMGGSPGAPRKDRSWNDRIFRAVAVDDRMVVADFTDPGQFDKRKVFLRRENAFFPVGADVAKALGLADDVKPEESEPLTPFQTQLLADVMRNLGEPK